MRKRTNGGKRLTRSPLSAAAWPPRLTWLAPILLLVSAAVRAQTADELREVCSGARQPFTSPPFERFDDDGDESLTPDEAAACGALEQIFSRLDLDGDRSLTRAEYRGFADVWRRRMRTLGDDAR